ncbi:MAG: hypothetical protein A3H49_06160 [Nitrospirae bacterium RIFCSPLOWO2_02_FULL_62_14]|nr:MAG: hypothetical protein A3H49_06160 [Nitrospirae bacterium RIFCSPLOWO2_02_FULL_62_14]OGW70141.1 MAG: hypothetical protein A3A88_06180 [Nitrospirae bacterium RIFCSPLOWO2_01_FULL_62_17]
MPGSPQLFLALPLLLILAAPISVYAETKVLTAEATYTMGDGETPSFAEAMALQKAKQMALEQAGTYVESYTKVQNYTLTADEIQTIAGGVLQVEVLDKKRELIGDGLRHYVKIKATVTTDKVQDLAQRIKGRKVGEEYKRLQEQYAQLLKEIESLKQQATKVSSGPERSAVIDQIREKEKVFTSVQRQETEFFERVFSGETLVSKALTQLAQKEKDEQRKKAVATKLLQTIQEEGHIITLGEPKTHVDPQYPDEIWFWFSVTVEISPSAISALSQAARELGGDIDGTTDESIGMDSKTANQFRKDLASWEFNLQWVLDNGKVAGACRDEERVIIRSIWNLNDYMHYMSSWGERKKKFAVGIEVPTKLAKRIKAARGKFNGALTTEACMVQFEKS